VQLKDASPELKVEREINGELMNLREQIVAEKERTKQAKDRINHLKSELAVAREDVLVV
jgi:cell division protein FtsL